MFFHQIRASRFPKKTRKLHDHYPCGSLDTCIRRGPVKLWLFGNFHGKVARGIVFSKDCGLSPCVFESDKRGVVDCIQSGRFLDASYGNIISAIAELILADNSMKIRTIPRSANQVAQRLAINALDTLENSFWMEDWPNCIMGLLQADLLV
ncbi:hypothetical protein Q3G72_019081 [Acer saccharum]|nr:hypothetical protein Q3G72_019081 [Acer saccharum]